MACLSAEGHYRGFTKILISNIWLTTCIYNNKESSIACSSTNLYYKQPFFSSSQNQPHVCWGFSWQWCCWLCPVRCFPACPPQHRWAQKSGSAGEQVCQIKRWWFTALYNRPDFKQGRQSVAVYMQRWNRGYHRLRRWVDVLLVRTNPLTGSTLLFNVCTVFSNEPVIQCWHKKGQGIDIIANYFKTISKFFCLWGLDHIHITQYRPLAYYRNNKCWWLKIIFPAVPGWVVLDRCGRHFSLVLNFLRDGSVPLPEDHRELDEVLKEAQYYRVQGLIQHCLSAMQVNGL